jgi:nucleoid-associated protein YgaU
MAETFARLMIELLDPVRGVASPITVRFNPTEFTRSKGVQLAEIGIPGLDSPILQFIRGQTEKLTLELFCDTSGENTGMGATSVTTQTEPFYQLVKIQSATHAPPRLRVTWGQALAFKAVVESVQQKFTLFSPDGIPVRATLTVTFSEYKTLEEQLAEMNKQSPDHTRQYVVREGDTLSLIAARAYDDPGAWRPIAEENQLDNPRRLVPGTVLTLPPLEFFRSKSARQR